ncbi:hypothetical protein C0995_002609 [Termitomyces sp. Mi166|nr:hypothetical protein C0995_002609 [Termitomyces sp. Mi166\
MLSTDLHQIACQLKVEALKWMEKGKNKGEKAVGVLKGMTERRATELVGSIRSHERLIRKVIASTPPPENDDDEEDEEEET